MNGECVQSWAESASEHIMRALWAQVEHMDKCESRMFQGLYLRGGNSPYAGNWLLFIEVPIKFIILEQNF